ncbi:zinc finger BED domain-containing protein RICESLEEPER 3-like [Arachis hypogaea]|uniref:zinc finger BED domain-containing protein RICESLEEPER 3-like n=1 Tax=Arachis hypogaea TaxID=3818 RepID=UPI000DEC4B2A|nr:zinc finger BED domain-containing protein RICESLEEPER 3-like isoform X2 [Arachis hypogaea]
MSSSNALSNTLEKSIPSEEPIATNVQTTQEAPQSQLQEPPTDTTTTNEGTTNSTSDVRKRKLTSEVWNHFKIVEIKGKLKVECNYCKSKLLGDPKQGTSHLRDHFKMCKLPTTRDIRQCMMKTTPITSGKTIVVGAYTFDQENARKELSIMVCLHEYPLSIVDHIGFQRFCNALQPLFKDSSKSESTISTITR